MFYKKKSDKSMAKRMVIKAKSMGKEKLHIGVVIKSAYWIKNISYSYLEQTKREINVKIDSDINEKNSYLNQSRAIECAINNLLERKKNYFKNMLVIINPYQYAPLCALSLFHTKKPCSVKVTVRGKTPDCNICYTISKAKNHRVPVMGLYAGYENIVDIELINEKGSTVKKSTLKIPIAAFQGKNSKIKIKKEFTKCNYLYNLTLVYGGGDDGIYPYAFDRNGDIRFCFSIAPKTYGFQPISNGRFLFLNKKVVRLTCTNPTATQLYEVDQMGRFHKLYNIEKGVHHEFIELEDGNLVAGSNSIYGNTFEDTIIEINRKTGNIVNEIKIKDYMDSKYVDMSDWAHLNSIQYNKKEKTVVACLRNLHCVVKINYETKELVWILGNPEFWKNSSVESKVLKPVDQHIKWFFQAHASYFLDVNLDNDSNTKQLIIYDNHSDKRRPVDYYDGEKYSYVRIYSIDEKDKTVSLLKSFSCQRSTIRSNAIFESEAQRIVAMSGKVRCDDGKFRGEVIEFDYNNGEVLNRFSMKYGFYRAYEFKLAVQEMAESMDINKNYVLGKIHRVRLCESPDVSSAKILPEPILEEVDKSEQDRSIRLSKLVVENPNYYIDPKQDMARIEFELVEDVLYVKLIDHLLEKIYFVGKNHTYCRDFTGTVQERVYFMRACNMDAIPLTCLEKDTYEIYFKHNTGLYKAGRQIKISHTAWCSSGNCTGDWV